MNPHPNVVKAYKKTLSADDKAGEYNHRGNKGRVTRANNHLSKMIKKHHPNLDSQGNINLRTKLQNMEEDAPTNAVAHGGVDLAPHASKAFKPINVTDRRSKKRTVLLKRFRDYIHQQNG